MESFSTLFPRESMLVGTNVKWIFIPIGELSEFFPTDKHILFSCLTGSNFSAPLGAEFQNIFSKGVYVRETKFQMAFQTHRRMFKFFPKYNDIYLPQCIVSEIFSAFGRKKWSPPPPPVHDDDKSLEFGLFGASEYKVNTFISL